MKKLQIIKYCICLCIYLQINSCKIPSLNTRNPDVKLNGSYLESLDTSNSASLSWHYYFTDPFLTKLIDTAVLNNQELNILLREIQISKNEIRARKGEYLPFGNLSIGSSIEKSGKYTFNGMSEEDIKDNKVESPRSIGEQSILANFSWELDIWRKLRNAKEAAVKRYLSTIEGRNFVITNLVAEIANSYYELLILHSQLNIIEKNIEIQKNVLEMIKIQKEAARLNQLAVNRFEAQLINTENLQFEIKQNITISENRINFLLGRNPQHIAISTPDLNEIVPVPFSEGVPSQLLSNRADIKEAALQVEASKLDLKVAKANFYPNVTLRSGIGLESFNPLYLINPKSIAFNLLGDMIAPLINRNGIKVTYFNANEKQLQTVINYERCILNAYIEVINELSASTNFKKSFETKLGQVEILNQSIDISTSLFKSARADYTEVLLTQREALEAKLELTEIKKKQLMTSVNLFKALGGGWR